MGSSHAEDPHDQLFEIKIQPLIKEYCYRCHGEEKLKGDVDLTTYTNAQQVFEDRRMWLDVLEQIETEEMPTKEPLPSAEEREEMVEWINTKLNSVDWTKIVDAGHVTYPRLNKREYTNTVNDLLGVKLDAGYVLNPDSEGQSGFTTDRDNLFMTPTDIDKYFTAASSALDVLTPVDKKRGVTRKEIKTILEAEDMLNGNNARFPDGVVGMELRIGQQTLYDAIDIPDYGQYKISIHGVPTYSDEGRLIVSIDNEEVGILVFPEKDKSSTQTLLVDIKPGNPQLALNVITDNQLARKKNFPKKFPFATAIDWVKIEGPLKYLEEKPLNASELITGEVDIYQISPSDKSESAAAQGAILRFTQRAFRRSVTDREIVGFMKIFSESRKNKQSFKESLKNSYLAVMMSPKFLYRMEMAPDEFVVGDYALDDFAIASRLSYFLWMSMPDNELFALASKGQLSDPEILRQQVKRMIQSPKLRSFSAAFLEQWLAYGNLGTSVRPDPEIFPEFTDELGEAMKMETVLTFEFLLKNGNSLTYLLDTKATFLNDELAKLYGIQGEFNKDMMPYKIEDRNRGGTTRNGKHSYGDF
ncbi:DUF1592 domain-containing protein [Akkermansiaceae bacterium]|nr:DUF1592 domain-containing protein [Akkermansiaceae bacterium]